MKGRKKVHEHGRAIAAFLDDRFGSQAAIFAVGNHVDTASEMRPERGLRNQQSRHDLGSASTFPAAAEEIVRIASSCKYHRSPAEWKYERYSPGRS